MASLSSDDDDGFDQQSERLDSYSMSADVSESDSSSTFSYYDPQTSSSSLHFSPLAGSFSRLSFDSPAGPKLMLPVVGGQHVINPSDKPQKPEAELSEVELMKERFSKLLLGEDMSGGGKGVCTALAISNAITNLSATVFGELWKLEPLAQQKKAMWYREMEWLLCVSDSIVELVPSLQAFPGGGTFEVMVTRPRSDLYINLPALKKLDAMLISMLDRFSESEFGYVDRGVVVAGGEDSEEYPLSPSSGGSGNRLEEKWWLPFPKVPRNGLSEDARNKLQQTRECTNQIFKAAMAINTNVLAEMEVPNVYLENLPKSGKACLGEILYRYITADEFFPECLIDYLDLSSEHTSLQIANRIEAAVHIWRQKYIKRHPNHEKPGKSSSWGTKVKELSGHMEKNKLYGHRAETLLNNLKLYFPGLPQTALDVNKIQYNKDVGQSILESYSRVMESLAFNIMARIDDLLHVDDATKQRAAAELVGRSTQHPNTQNPYSVQCNNSQNRTPRPCSVKRAASPRRRTRFSAKKSELVGSLDENIDRLTFK